MEQKIVEKIKFLLKYMFIYICFVFVFIIVLTVTSKIPTSAIQEKTTESADILLTEGNRKISYIPYKDLNMQFDNYSDALMINTAYSIDPNSPLYSAMVARKNYIPGVTQTIEQDSEKELKSASKYKYHNEVGELKDVTNNDITESFEYARYWHGYLVVLRPLLTFANIRMIRIIFTVIFVILACLLFYQLKKKINLFVAIIFLIGLIGVEYFYIGISIQSSFVFMITMISSLIILIRGNKIKDVALIFFIVGILTNFLDLLTVPAISYGVPILVYFLTIQKEKEFTLKEIIFVFFKYGIAWLAGYAITWITKWILVDLLYNRNLIGIGLNQVLYRSVGGAKINYLSIVKENIYYLKYFAVAPILFSIIYLCANIISKRKNEKIYTILPYFIIALIPFMWYFIIRDHSYKHAFFTYRNLILSIISVPIGFYYLFESEPKKEKIK